MVRAECDCTFAVALYGRKFRCSFKRAARDTMNFFFPPAHQVDSLAATAFIILWHANKAECMGDSAECRTTERSPYPLLSHSLSSPRAFAGPLFSGAEILSPSVLHSCLHSLLPETVKPLGRCCIRASANCDDDGEPNWRIAGNA